MAPDSSPSSATKIATIALASSALSAQVVVPAHAYDTSTTSETSPDLQCTRVTTADTPSGTPSAQDIHEAEQNVARAEQTLQGAIEEHDSAAQQTNEYENALILSQAELSLAERERNEAQQNLSEQITREQSLVDQAYNNARIDNEREIAGLALARSELNTLQEEREHAYEEYIRASEELVAKRTAVEAASTPADRETGNELPTSNALNARIDTLNEQIVDLDRIIERVSTERDEIQRRHTELAAQVVATAEEESAAQDRVTQATENLVAAQQALQTAEENLMMRREDLARATQEAGPDSEAVRQARNNLAEAENERAQTSIALESLTQELAERQHDVQQAQESLDARNSEVVETERALSELNDQIGALEEEIQAANRARQERQAELAEVTKQLEQLRTLLVAEESKENIPTFDVSDVVSREILTHGLALFRDNGGNIERLAELASAPRDLNNYFLRSSLPDGRELSMPVTSIEENTQGDNPTFTVHATVPGGFSHIPTVTLSVPKSDPQAPTVYRTFASLVEAMNATPDGTFRVGADLQVDSTDVAHGQAYVTVPFTGALDGQGHSISGLIKPLFSVLTNGAQVKNLAFASVHIDSSDDNAAALAQRAEGQNTHVRHVRVQGRIEGQKFVGAIVAEAQNATFESVFFDGQLYSNWRREGGASGGLIGAMSGGTVRNSAAQVTIETFFRRPNNAIGGLVGRLTDGAVLSNSYVGGTLGKRRNNGMAGGIVGSLRSENGNHGAVDSIVSGMAVTGGNLGHGDNLNVPMRNITYIDGEASGTPDAHHAGTQVSVTQGQAAYEALNLTHHVRPQSAQNQSVGVVTTSGVDASPNRYSTVAEARVERFQAYRNYALLMPLASPQMIVHAANMLEDSDPLVTKTLRSALPTIGGQIAFAPIDAAQTVDGVFLHYSDHSVERRVVRPQDKASAANASSSRSGQTGRLDRGAFVVYQMAGGLPYAPVRLATPSQALVAQMSQELAAVEFDDIDMSTLVDAAKWRTTLSTKQGSETERKDAASAELRGLLYLRNAFNQQRDSLNAVLEKIIAQERTTATAPGSEEALKRKIRDNKEAFLLGLAYVNKWYNIDFGAVNLRDLLVFRQDFYGSRKSPIDWLIELGKDYYHLDPQKNTETLVKYVSPYARHVDVVELLESTRQQFTTTRDFDEWFRGTTKAHVVETPSLELPDHDVRASERFKRTKYKAALLPVLTVRENDIFIMVHMTSVTMGSFERYYDKRHLSAEQRAGKIEEIKRRIQYYAQRYRDYYDMWYRVSSDKAKRHLLNDIPAWDGYGTAAGWSAQYGSSAIRSVEDFFGPIGKWYQASPVGAYSSGDATFMVHTKSLEPYGITIFTHEMVHNLDRFVFLGGEGRRIYVLPEMYPVSLLQNPTTRSSGAFGFNQSADFSNHNGWYLHNAHPDRFQTMTDMDQYFKGYFNAIYLLDLAEAEAMIGQSPEALSKMLMKLGNHVTQGVTVNSYDALSAQDIADMRLASINDMIDHSLMMRRVNAPTNGPIERNGYPNVTILDPIYGTGESSVGTTGETAFRRNALELWAAKGFEEGFVPYTSSRLLGEARREGAGDMPDTFIMPKIFASDPYSTLKDYRKQAYAMIRQRATTHLQPITVSFDGIQETYTTLEELATRFRELMAEDIAHSRQGSTRSKVYRFKGEVFSQLMRQTQEFKSSMFTDDVDQLLPWTMLRKPEATVRVPLPALERPSLDRSQEKFAVPPTASLDEATMTELRRQVTDAETQVRHAQEAFRAADSELLDNQETLKTFQLRRDNRNEALTSARQAMARAEAEARKAVDALGFSRDRKIASEAQIQQLDSHIEHLLSALATLRQRVAVHQSAFDHAQQLRQERSAEVEQMFRRFSEAQEEFAAAEASLKNAQQSLTDTLAQLRAVEARILQDSTQREDRDREVLRLQSLRALMLAFEAAKQLSDATDLRHASVLDRLTRAEQTTERAQTRVEELAATVSRLQERQRHLAGLTVDALLIGSQTEEAPQIVEGLQELRRRIALVQDALRRYEDAQQDISRHSAALAALQQDRENAQVALMQARVDLDRLKTTLSEQNGGDEYSCVPRVAPYLPYLPSYEIEVLPGNAPVVESLPTYEIGSVSEPETIVPSSPQADSAEHTTHDLVPYGTSIESTFEHQPNAQSAQNNPVTLARTGGGTAMLGTISAIGAALGIAALRGRRRRE